ncbi:helix-turn-helix domain-containing protein [Streptomyces zaomyceticus]|uniref:helix-turn-helix domain-containing protein n=1 Tax=Streptomyces zaomyceticus TaxID=68286 RepID=UPI0038B50DEE
MAPSPEAGAAGARARPVAAKLRRRYEQDGAARDLTRESGRSYSFIDSLLTEYGVTFRPRGGDQRSRR